MNTQTLGALAGLCVAVSVLALFVFERHSRRPSLRAWCFMGALAVGAVALRVVQLIRTGT